MEKEAEIILNIISAIVFFSICGIIITKTKNTLKKTKKANKKTKNMTPKQRSQYYQDEANKAIIKMSKYWRGR